MVKCCVFDCSPVKFLQSYVPTLHLVWSHFTQTRYHTVGSYSDNTASRCLKRLWRTFSFCWFRRPLWTKAVMTQVPAVIKIFASVCQTGRTWQHVHLFWKWGEERQQDGWWWGNVFKCDWEISYKSVIWQQCPRDLLPPMSVGRRYTATYINNTC